MATDDALIAAAEQKLAALEADVRGWLDFATRDAIEVVAKGAVDVQAALDTLEASFAGQVLDARALVRAEAAKHFARECGIDVAPSGADDAERGPKAATYYAKAWADALDAGAPDWAAALEQARAAAEPALANVAGYEVFDAWNDEHLRALIAANAGIVEAAKKVGARWVTQRDKRVCPACKKLDGKYSDADGKFPGDHDPPPLHLTCRCFLVVPKKDDAPAEGADGEKMTIATIDKREAHDASEIREPLLLTRAFHVKAIDEQKRTADFIASTGVVDAHDEIVDQGSWLLDDFMKNPVVLFAHESRELPIGRALDVGVRTNEPGIDGPCLVTRIEFAPADMNPKAEQVFRMVQAKYLRAVSVGFVPKSYRFEMRDGVEVWVWADNVLKEISVTPVPANPQALAKMKSLAHDLRAALGSGVKRGGDVEALWKTARAADDLTRRVRAATGSKTPPATVPGGDTENHGAPSRKEDKAMSDNDKSLQDKVEKQAATIALHEAEVTKQSARADKAEADARAIETKLAAITTERDALDAQTKALAAERDAATARAEKAEALVIEQEVDALVGKKITPAEKPLFVDLRRSNPDLFAKMIEQRQPLALDAVVTERKGNDITAPRTLDAKASVDKTIKLVEQLGKG